MENILSLVSKFGSTSHHHIVVKVCLWFCLISFKKNREILVYISHVKRKTFVKIIQFEKTKIISRLASDFVGFQDEFKIWYMCLRSIRKHSRVVLDDLLYVLNTKFYIFDSVYNRLLHIIKLDYTFKRKLRFKRYL